MPRCYWRKKTTRAAGLSQAARAVGGPVLVLTGLRQHCCSRAARDQRDAKTHRGGPFSRGWTLEPAVDRISSDRRVPSFQTCGPGRLLLMGGESGTVPPATLLPIRSITTPRGARVPLGGRDQPAPSARDVTERPACRPWAVLLRGRQAQCSPSCPEQRDELQGGSGTQ